MNKPAVSIGAEPGASATPIGRWEAFLVRWPAAGWALWLLAGLVVWISLVDVPMPVAGPHHDRSWAEAYGYFARHHWQAGRDYIFTCGPLGHLRMPVYNAEGFWFGYFWQLFLAGALTCIFLRFAAQLPGLALRVLFCAAIVVPRLVSGSTSDALLMFAVVAAFVLVVGRERGPTYWQIILFTLFAALLALMKFFLLEFSVVAIGLLIWRLLMNRQFALTLLAAASWGVFLFGIWRLAGQSPGNFYLYVRNSWEVMAGYTEAMAIMPARIYLGSAAVVLVLLAVAVVPRTAGDWRAWGQWRQLTMVALALTALFVSWKHSFVRSDPGHVQDFFEAVLLTSFLVPAIADTNLWKRRWRIGPLVATGALSLAVILLAAHQDDGFAPAMSMQERLRTYLQYVFAPSWQRDELERDRQKAATAWNLPAIKARVGGDTVDLVSFEQGVLFLNDLNWKPRPAFQSNTAYTPRLLAINRDCYRSADAPKFILFKLQTIDGRLPTVDDGEVLEDVLWGYEPVLREQSYLLLERRLRTQRRQPTVVLEKEIQLGEEVLLDAPAGDCQSVSLKLRPTWRGRLLKFLFQVPKVYLELRTANDQSASFRLVPGMAERGFLLNPLLLDDADVLEYFGPRRGRRVVSLRVTGSPWGCYEQSIHLTVSNYAKPGKVYPLPDAGQDLVRASYAETHNKLGQAALDGGQIHKAIEHFQQSLQQKPDVAESHLHLGVALQSQGKVGEAIQEFQQAVRLKPEWTEAHVNLGLALLAKGKTDDAIGHFQDALRRNMNGANAHAGLGLARQSRGQFDEAIASYREALRIKPDHIVAHYNLGKALKKQGSLDEAIRHYQEALRLRPELAEVENDLGVALHARGRIGEATAHFRQALLLKPDFLEAHNNLGLALQGLGRTDEAIAQYKLALRQKPDYPSTRRNLGLALQSTGQLDEAKTQYRELIRLKPDHPEAYNNLAMILATSVDPAQRDGKQAVELAEKAKQLSLGKDPGILDTLAAAYAEAGDFARAVEQQKLALDIVPEAKKADYHTRLELYQAKRPLRQEPKK